MRIPRELFDSDPIIMSLKFLRPLMISDPHQVTHFVYLTITNVVEPPYFDAGNTLPISINENESGLTID